MTTIEILLIILGFVFVGLSFLIGSKANPPKKYSERTGKSKELWTEKDDEIVKERIASVVEEKTEAVIDHTTDRLNHLSNEKIMAVDEFSTQVLEKIEQNHQEVVFLYSMLEEKERQIKALQAKPVTRETRAKKAEKPRQRTKDTRKVKTQPEQNMQQMSSMAEVSDINQSIIDLYKSGKNVLEISKILDMGQGEVKLVVDLYGGK